MADLACQAYNAISRDLVSFLLLDSPRPSTYFTFVVNSVSVNKQTWQSAYHAISLSRNSLADAMSDKSDPQDICLSPNVYRGSILSITTSILKLLKVVEIVFYAS